MKLLVKYAAELVFTNGSFQLSSGTEVLIHFEDLSLGSGIIYEIKSMEQLIYQLTPFIFY